MTPKIENQTIDRLRIGDSTCVRRRIARSDIGTFVSFAGDIMDEAIDRELAADPGFRAALSGGGIAATLLCALIAARLPGPGSKITRLHLDIENPLRHEDEAVARAQVAELDPATASVTLEVSCTREDGTLVLSGRIEAIAPDTPVSRPFRPAVALDTDTAPHRLEQIEDLAKRVAPGRMAIVNPVDKASLTGALESAEAGLITPVLFGPEAEMRVAAEAGEHDLSEYESFECPDASATAEKTAAKSRAAIAPRS